MKEKWSHNKHFLLRKTDFGVLANNPAVHNGGVSKGGSLAVAVGVSDM